MLFCRSADRATCGNFRDSEVLPVPMPARNLGGIPQKNTGFSLSIEMSRLTRDGTAETVSRDQTLRRERGQGNIHFACSGDHEQDWQPYPVSPYPCLYLMTMHTYILG